MEFPFSDMDWLDTASNTLDLAIQKGLYTEFSHLKSDLDRIRFIHNHRTNLLSNTFERYLSSTSSSCLTKNATTAINFRKKGNDYFVEKDLSRAAWCYRASIALSTINSQDMALSYGNLSAVLFELNHYHESIRAIQLANDFYPNELKFKLVFRRAACYHKLNDPERSAYELKICRDLIKKTAGLDRKKIDSFCKEMDQLSRQIAILNKRKEEELQQQQQPTTSYKNLDDLVQNSPTPTETIATCLLKSTEEKTTDEFCPPSPPSPPRSMILIDESKLLLNGPNKYIPCASSTVRVSYSKDKGRHIVANQDIPSDALILNERPYACLLLPKFAYTYCDHCLTAIVIPYVCPQCSHVLFCSEHCQQRALASYHQYECKHIHILKTLGIAFLAYRTLTITDHETLWTTITQTTIPNDNEEQNNNINNNNNNNNNNNIYKSDYSSIQKLITHTEQMSIDDLFHYSLTAYLLSEIIKSTNFLRCNQIKKRDTEQILLASILLKHIQQMICNAQTISITKTNQNDDIIFDNDDDHDEITKRFASAIFPTCALMNHSCVPNIRCVFDQGYLRVYTAKTIRQGEEILNCYGPQKSLMSSIEQRQNVLLEQYFTSATRKLHNPKTTTTTTMSNSTDQSQSQSLIVHDSQQTNDITRFYLTTSDKLLEAKRIFSQGLSSYTHNHSSWEQSFKLLNDSIRLYEQILREINLDTVNLYEYIASIYNDRNQFEYTCMYLNKCISILKMNLSTSCSSTTILLVDVLRKYAQTLFNCRKFDDARRTIIEAQILLDQMTSTSTISISEDEKRTIGVLQTIEDLKAKCDLCLG
ncbi:unnamed protein product [Rotaria sp. Silwood2]|nr:unnamed protein product [Rotaria sp. Silwood2]